MVRIPSGIELTKLPSDDTELDTLSEADNVCITSDTELSKCPSDENEINLVSETNGMKKGSITELYIHSAKSVPVMGSVKDIKSYSNLKTFDIALESNVARKVGGNGKMAETKINVVYASSKMKPCKEDLNELYRVSPENVYMANQTKLNTYTDSHDNQSTMEVTSMIIIINLFTFCIFCI